MEEETLYDRIGEADLNPTYKDGQVYQHTDINNMLSILKTAVNENYYDIQKLENGTKDVEKAKTLDGATLSRYLDETLQADDNKVPSSQQAKAYMDNLFAEYSPPIRGVDYWTEEDKEEIIDEAIEESQLKPKGDYDPTVEYKKLDIVLYQNSSYVALQTTQGNLPTDTDYWQILVSGELSVDDIIDNLESNYSDKVLSAKQGRILNESKIQVFDNVSSMKSSNLKNGITVQTLGYYSINDGGGAIYKITNTVSQIEYQEELNNGLYANLIIEDTISFEMFGAKGDGITDDSESIKNAVNSELKIVCYPNKTYLISEDINVKNLIIDFNNSKVKSINGNSLKPTNNTSKLIITNGIFENVCIVDTVSNETNHYYDNCIFFNTTTYGLQLQDVNELYVNNCLFNNIGTGTIDITYQGCGIRVNTAEKVIVNNSIFKNCHGTGALVIRNTKLFKVYDNLFDKNDYRGIALAGSDVDPIGSIENNIIMNCGVYASHNTGVGCNGIYGNDVSNATGITIRGNNILNVCENAIEGAFGLVEYNYVDGTGVDQVNHPTPSASGINMYGGIYRYNVVKNSYLAGLYVSGVSHSESTVLENKKIYGNNIGKPTSTNVAIYVNGTEYHNIDIYDNVIEGTITLPVAAKFYKCAIGNNFSLKGMPFTNNNAATYLLDKGAITFNGFGISGTSITNITTASCSYVIGESDVTFTSTGTNGAFSFISNCNKNTINVIKFITNDATSEIKLTVYGIKEDDTQTTLASNRLLQVQNNITGLFIANDNTYKQFKFLVTIGNTSTTLKLKNVQVKEITY